MCTGTSPSPKFISQVAVLKIHKDLIEKIGGSMGLRDEGLLDSALAQPKQAFNGCFLHSTIYEQAAAYLFHLVKNHAFVDGNKRVALATTIAFLEVNGYKLTLSKSEVEELVLAVANNKKNRDDVTDIFQTYVVPK